MYSLVSLINYLARITYHLLLNIIDKSKRITLIVISNYWYQSQVDARLCNSSFSWDESVTAIRWWTLNIKRKRWVTSFSWVAIITWVTCPSLTYSKTCFYSGPPAPIFCPAHFFKTQTHTHTHTHTHTITLFSSLSLFGVENCVVATWMYPSLSCKLLHTLSI